MPLTLEPPKIDNAPKFFADLDTTNKDELGDASDFPSGVVLIDLGGNRYAAVNATTPGPDPMTVGLLACFPSEQEALIWENAWKLTGAKVTKTFQEARELAVSKSNIAGLGLQVMGRTVAIHWVR